MTKKPKKKDMEKVKIKRVKRNKKVVTAKEKILTGLGVASAFGGMATGSMQKPQAKPAIVASQTKNQKSKLKEAGDAISRFFKVPEAKGFYEDPFDPYTGLDNSGLFSGGGRSAGGGAPQGGSVMGGVYSSPEERNSDLMNSNKGTAGTQQTGLMGNANTSAQSFAGAVSGIQTGKTIYDYMTDQLVRNGIIVEQKSDGSSYSVTLADGTKKTVSAADMQANFQSWSSSLSNPNILDNLPNTSPNSSILNLINPGVPTEPISPTIQRGIDQMNNTPAPKEVGVDASGNKIYFNNGQFQDYTGNVYISNIENGQTVYTPTITTDPLNLSQGGAGDRVPNFPIEAPNIGVSTTGQGNQISAPTATPDGLPFIAQNGNVLTDANGKVWLWDGQNLNQRVKETPTATPDGLPFTEWSGNTATDATGRKWSWDGESLFLASQETPNPLAIHPPMALGGSGTWDNLVAQFGGTAGSDYIVVGDRVYTRQQWESGLLPGQQGPVLPTVTPEIPYMTVNANVTPVEYVPAVYNFQGVRTDNQAPEIPVTLPGQNNSGGISNYITALGQQGVMALLNTDGTYTLLNVSTGQTEQKTLEQIVASATENSTNQPSEQNIISRGVGTGSATAEQQVQGLSDEDLVNANRQISNNLINELVNNNPVQTPVAQPAVNIPALTQAPIVAASPVNPTSPVMSQAELNAELAKYQSKQVETVQSDLSSVIQNNPVTFAPLTLVDGTKVTTINGQDYKDAKGNSYFYVGVQGQDLMKYDSKAREFVSVSAVTDQQESGKNTVQNIAGEVNKVTQKISTLQENAIKKVGKLFKKNNTTTTVSNSSNEPTVVTSDGTELYDIGYNKDNPLLIDFDGNIYVKNAKTNMSINPENASGFANYTAYWQEHGDIQTKNGTPLYDIGKDANGNSIFIDSNSNTYNSSGKSMDLTLVEPTSKFSKAVDSSKKVGEQASGVASIFVPQAGMLLKAVSYFNPSQEKSFNTWMADANKSDSAILHFTFTDPSTGRESTLDISKGDIKIIISNTDSIYGSGSDNTSSSLKKFGSLIPGLGTKP